MLLRWKTRARWTAAVAIVVCAAASGIAPATAVAAGAVTFSVSSSVAGGAAALSDGSVARGAVGAEWVSAEGDAAPWARATWSTPTAISSLQIFGPTPRPRSSSATDTAALWGTLTFSDGSSIVVSGIDDQAGAATTIAFPARTITWARLELHPSSDGIRPGLRELVFVPRGSTPTRWPTHSAPRYATTPPAAGSCSAGTPPFGSSADGSPFLVCPAPGSRVYGQATVVVGATAGTRLVVEGYLPTADGRSGSVEMLTDGVAGSDGRAVLQWNASSLTQGPAAVRVRSETAGQRPLYVQLFNSSGRPRPPADTAPAGLTLQWRDSFTAPIALSRSGAGADYATLKPEATGGSEFGDAIFADPSWQLGTLTTVDRNFLRIRLRPTGSFSDPQEWGRTLASGLVSSARLGGSGFAAQYGYFEARMLGPSAEGTWPAFWLLNTENAAPRSRPASEVDIVELYGRFPRGSCHVLHAWDASGNSQSVCREDHVPNDWALSWHTYGARVRPDRVDYFIDGALVTSIPGPILTDQPFYFMIDLAAGGGWPVDLRPTGGVADLYVDWVRVYT